MDGNYPLKKEIGSGSYGKVYQAYSNKTKTDVAIKRVLKKDIKSNDYLYKAFWKELEIMKKCECPNTVKYIDFIESVNNYNIVMELCDSDLDIILNKTTTGFKAEEVKRILIQLNNVFAIMAQEHIMHRDLKLKNILIKFIDETKTAFTVKLSDFGFSKVCEGDTTGTKLGTPVTMAPEIIRQENYTSKADLWSIGVMVYQLLFKELPFRGRNEKAIYQMIMQGPPKMMPSDPLLKDLLLRLLTVDPNLRISWEEYFNHPFFQNSVLQVYELKEEIPSYYNNTNCQLWKGIEKVTKRSVYIRKIRKDSANLNNINKEISLIKLFTGNKYVCQFIDAYEDQQWKYIVSEYFPGVQLETFCNSNRNVINEDFILQLVKELYENIFSFAAMNNIAFDIISNCTFIITRISTKAGYHQMIKMLDFGLNHLFIDKATVASLNLNNPQPIVNQQSNILNFGILLYKLLFGCDFTVAKTEKAVRLPCKISSQLKSFLSKCCFRNPSKRFTWDQIGRDAFVAGIVVNNYVLQDNKLEMLLSSFTKKIEIIVNYYLELTQEELRKSIKHISIFLFLTLIETKMVQKIFSSNSNNYCQDEELHLMEVLQSGKFNYSKLNFASCVNTFNKKNPLISVYMKKINDLVNPLIDITSKIMKMNNQIIPEINKENSIRNILTNFHSAEIHTYFFEIFNQALEAFDAKNSSLALKKFYIAQFLYEDIIFIKLIAMNQVQTIELKDFLTKIDEEEDEIYISAIQHSSSKAKKKFVLFSFLGGIIANCKENDVSSQSLIILTNQTMNELITFYPDVLKMTISAETNLKKHHSLNQ